MFENKKFPFPLRLIEDNTNKEITVNALEFFYSHFNAFATGISNRRADPELSRYIFYNIAPYYIGFDFLEKVRLPNSTAQRIQTTKLGSSFYAMLESQKIMNE